jgi:superfamily II DNA or RNA helicase
VPTAIVDTHIRLNTAELPPRAADWIRRQLAIPNEEKINQRRMGVRGWQRLPDTIQFWHDSPGGIVVPRGFAVDLRREFEKAKVEIVFDDRRVTPPMTEPEALLMKPPDLRSYQEAAVEGIIRVQQGIYQAPPGSGKTVTVIGAVQRLTIRSLIIVDRSNIAEQWIERFKEHAGYEPGMIGDGVWDERDVTIAMVQTLWARKNELADWWKNWGLVGFDECHHLPAATWTDIGQRFPARYRFGVSGTPKRTEIQLMMAKAVVGKIFHRTEKSELQKLGILVVPRVETIETGFRSNHGGRKYHKLAADICDSVSRNEIIARAAYDMCLGKHGLIATRRLNQLDAIRKNLLDLGWPEHLLLSFTGKESREERTRVMRTIDQSLQSITLSTIAQEAVDVPVWSRLFLAWPTSQELMVEQLSGRIERRAPGKEEAAIIEFLDDTNTGRNQFIKRLRVYEANGFHIVRNSEGMPSRL